MESMAGMSTASNASPMGDGSDIKLLINTDNEMESQMIRSSLIEALTMMQSGLKDSGLEIVN